MNTQNRDKTAADREDPITSEDVRDLTALLRLQRDLKNIGSFERLLHVVLRLAVSRFQAQYAAAIAADRHGAPVIVHQLGDGEADLEWGQKLLNSERPKKDPHRLYSIIKENQKTAAVLVLHRDTSFERADLRALQRFTEVANEALEHLAAARVRDVANCTTAWSGTLLDKK
jgi:hypothetical protein